MNLIKKVIVLVGIFLFISSGNIFAKTKIECQKEFTEENNVLIDQWKEFNETKGESGIDQETFTNAVRVLSSERDKCIEAVDKEYSDKRKECNEKGFAVNEDGTCREGEGNDIYKNKKEVCEKLGGKFFNGLCTGISDATSFRLLNKTKDSPYSDEEVKEIIQTAKTGKPVSSGNTGISNLTIVSVPTLEEYCKIKNNGGTPTGGLLKFDGGICDGVNVHKGKGEGYNALIETANKVIEWIVDIALLIAAAVAFYGGWLYISSATNPSARAQANKLFTNVAIGLFLIFTAWLIVQFILTVFARGDATTSDIDNNYKEGTSGFSGLQKK